MFDKLSERNQISFFISELLIKKSNSIQGLQLSLPLQK